MSAARLLALAAACLSSSAFAYQVTGTVEEVTDSKVVVLATGGKNKGEKFEVARVAATKVEGELVKGAKVTVEYTLEAQSIEVKAEKAKGKAKK